MRIIDADTHIDETDATWEYFGDAELSYKPTTTYPSNPDPKLPPARYWMIDGKRQVRLPAGFLALEAGADYIMGRVRDELGVEYVNVYKLAWK